MIIDAVGNISLYHSFPVLETTAKARVLRELTESVSKITMKRKVRN